MKTIRTQFNSTQDAEQYGRAIKHDKETIAKLHNAYADTVTLFYLMEKLGGFDLQIMHNISVRGQFIREAYQAAEEKTEKETGGNEGVK